MSDPTPPTSQGAPASGSGAVLVAALAAALCAALPWYTVDVDSALARVAGASWSGELVRVTGPGSSGLVVQGAGTWFGLVALLAALVAAGAILVETTRAVEPKAPLVVTFLASCTAVSMAFVAVTRLGDDVRMHVGLALVLFAAGTLAGLAYRRLQRYGELRTAGTA